MKKLLNTLILIVLLSVVGCAGSSSPKEILTHAEQLVEISPDSALRMVLSIKRPEQLRCGIAARYAVVRTLAEVECHHTFISDSLIRVAVGHYGDDSALLSALAYYCWGCVCASKGDDEFAAAAYLRAKSLFPDKYNRYYGLSSENLAALFYKKGMYEKALEEFWEARKHLSFSGSNQYTFAYNIGMVYLALDNYDMANSGFNSIAYDESEAARPYRLMALHQLTATSCLERKFFAAHYYINQCLHLFAPEELFAGVYATKGDILVAHEELDSALHYYRKGLECPYEPHSYAAIYNGLANVFRYRNMADSVRHYQKLEVQINKSIEKDKANDRMYTILSSFQVEQALADIEEKQKKQELLRYREIALLLFVAIVLMALFAWFFKRQKRRYSYTIRLLSTHYPFLSAVCRPYLTPQLLESTMQLPSLQLPPDTSFSDMLQVCADSFKATALYDELFSLQIKASEIVQLHHYTRSEELRESLFLHFSPIIRELCSHIRLSDKHIIHCLCRYLDVPTATIAYCLHTTVRSLSKDKTRLQQKLPETYAAILLGHGGKRGRPKSL